MDIAEKIQLVISYILRGALLFAIGIAAFDEQWVNLFSVSTIFIVTFLPALISRNFKIVLPIEFDVVIVIFTYATLYLGELKHFYLRFTWWDMLLHGTSALIFGFIGFLIVYILNHEKRLEIRMVPKFVALFSFCFSLAIGAIWEIFEFNMDHFFGFNMQKSGINDTMKDLMLDGFGAIIASFLGYLYLRRGEALFFARFIRKFVARNPKIFQKETPSELEEAHSRLPNS